jgi:hypothetical protein
MAAKFSVSKLRAQSENLQTMFTDLGTFLSKLKLERSKREGSSNTEALEQLVGLAEFNASLCEATDIFYQRLHLFLERSKVGDGLTS